MWLFCKSGFFSAVKHNQKKGTVHVRARFKGDLERLFTAHAVRAKVVETPNGDYRFRADVPGSVWRRVVAKEAASIDYTNFKGAVHDGTERDDAYFEVWCAMKTSQANDAAKDTLRAAAAEIERRLCRIAKAGVKTAADLSLPTKVFEIADEMFLNEVLVKRLSDLRVRGRVARVELV